MTGRNIESAITQFEKVPSHPAGPLPRYTREVETPTGKKTVIILDVHRDINPNPENLKRLGLTASYKKP